MDVIFQVDVRKKDRKLEERYRRTAFDLYRKGTRRSAGAWVLLIWYSIVLIISLGGGGGAYTLRSFIVEALLVFDRVPAVSQPGYAAPSVSHD